MATVGLPAGAAPSPPEGPAGVHPDAADPAPSIEMPRRSGLEGAVTSERSALTIRSTPVEAEVFVDGESVGTTPLDLDVSAGEHVIRAHRDGYADWSTRLTTMAGETEEFDVVLSQQVAGGSAVGGKHRRKHRRQGGHPDAVTVSKPLDDGETPSRAESTIPPKQPSDDHPHADASTKRFEKLGKDRGLKTMGGRALK